MGGGSGGGRGLGGDGFCGFWFGFADSGAGGEVEDDYRFLDGWSWRSLGFGCGRLGLGLFDWDVVGLVDDRVLNDDGLWVDGMVSAPLMVRSVGRLFDLRGVQRW